MTDTPKHNENPLKDGKYRAACGVNWDIYSNGVYEGTTCVHKAKPPEREGGNITMPDPKHDGFDTERIAIHVSNKMFAKKKDIEIATSVITRMLSSPPVLKALGLCKVEELKKAQSAAWKEFDAFEECSTELCKTYALWQYDKDALGLYMKQLEEANNSLKAVRDMRDRLLCVVKADHGFKSTGCGDGLFTLWELIAEAEAQQQAENEGK